MTKPLFQPTKHQEYCPKCGSLLQIKQGKKGRFLGCSAYPQCDYLKPLHPQTELKILKNLPQNCPECGHSLQLKQGHFGIFIGCSQYPQCHYIVHDQAEISPEIIPCPQCQKGNLVARRGRQGKLFYGCDRFPECNFTLPSKPYQINCPKCGFKLCTLKKETANSRIFLCANKACRHSFEEKNDDSIPS